ncbi:LamG-like jellyroll fold domain-containing protein [Flavivirga spongiicola]|uniref:Endonuclease/exonuclease/phosphatase family protein n=1 Tax=Flavivirga spongiicola TaxID=421621 RepID=A0ABU7XMB6_9FLAO|nr:LamG-like jellyroll fold domain-containing protein [Flavivirga sp. MEBiC05379]MDO5981375.1 LamG-like jellyroll fold domain-containing protein [Flavivirga sp. MEBiC05379]
MKQFTITNLGIVIMLVAFSFGNLQAQKKEGQLLFLDFDSKDSPNLRESNANLVYGMGIKGKGLDIEKSTNLPKLKDFGTDWFSNSKDFSISVWVKSAKVTTDTTIILSNADFRKKDMGIYKKRRINPGFTLYSSNGAWGWNIGNGSAYYNYEPIAKDQPITDNIWHQIVFTYNASRKEVRLFYDGINRAILSIGDLSNRDFASNKTLMIGKDESESSYKPFQGVVDQLEVSTTTLSQKQIQKAFKKHAKIQEEPEMENDVLTVLNWNIWHGGSHFLKDRDGFDGVERIIEMIKKSGADIVMMQETYGSGSIISSSLGYYYYEASSTIGAVWGANISVMSRYPIEDVYMIEERSNYGKNYAFNNGGAKIRLSKKNKVIAFSNWYNGRKPEDLDGALKGWAKLVNNADDIPIVWAGDFNSVSHLDDGIGKSGHSKLMTNAGFKDSYRELYPDAKKYPCYSAPRNEDKIDFIYYKGVKLKLIEAGKIIENFKGKNTLGYPSDHLGLTSKFKFN